MLTECIQCKIAVLRYKVLQGIEGLRHVIWVRSSVCLIYRVGVLSVLPAQLVWSCRHSKIVLLAVEPSKLQAWNGLPEL